MKTIFAICLMSLATMASATTVKIYEVASNELHAEENDFKYGVNTELGRAWVVAHETEEWSEPVSYDTNIKVNGLSYNAETGAIEFKSGSEVVECAFVVQRGRGIFKSTRINETGRCSFEVVITRKSVDDGFNVRNVKFSEVYFTAE